MSSENPSFESYQAEFRRLNFLERYQIEEFPDTDTVLLRLTTHDTSDGPQQEFVCFLAPEALHELGSLFLDLAQKRPL